MQQKNDVLIQDEGGDRRLSLGAVRIHNRHLQSGGTTAFGCRICEGGLEAAFEDIAGPPAREVAEGDGDDKAGDASSSPDPGPDPWAT